MRVLFAVLALLSVMSLTTPVFSQQSPCAPRDQVVELLNNQYGETRRSIGIAGQAAVMELFASDETGTWSITMTMPDGMMCLMASGSNYEAVTEELPPQGELN